MRPNNAHGSRREPGDSVWLSGSGSTGHCEPTRPSISAIRGLWFYRGIGNNFCSYAGLDCDAQASVQRRNESEDGGHHGSLSNIVGLLRPVDSFAAGDRMECDCGVDQSPERGSLLSFRSQESIHSDAMSHIFINLRRFSTTTRRKVMPTTLSGYGRSSSRN
jgi:hypothetical protein